MGCQLFFQFQQSRMKQCSIPQAHGTNDFITYLVIMDEQGLMMPQREEFRIDIAFAVDDFDFFS